MALSWKPQNQLRIWYEEFIAETVNGEMEKDREDVTQQVILIIISKP
jgi:hypothetical protein